MYLIAVLTLMSAVASTDIQVRPLDVHLIGENHPFSAASEYEVACQSTGSRPPAAITWWKGGRVMDHTRETTSPDGNVTVSTLTLSPEVDDSGKSLTCRANNPHVPGSAMEDTWILSVHYSPVLYLELGSNLNGSSIREGVDVYFECNIQANPWIYKVIWRHNGNQLSNNASTGIIISNQTLVLQSVSRNISGLYTCLASNTEGETESNAFNLDVKYEPVCIRNQQRVYGAARHEEIQVICDVDANPPATSFRWSFNNSAVQSLEIKSANAEPGGGRSTANYTPRLERDYGTLLCWSKNELGIQGAPCVFHIVPAGKPDAPGNCKVTNRTSTSVQVSCMKGFDGGLPQEFTMELFSVEPFRETTKRLVSNVTSRNTPEFTVTGLESGMSFLVHVYSSNGKGRSSEVRLEVSTLKTTQQEHRRTSATAVSFPSLPQVTPMLWILAGIVVTLGAVGIIVAILLRTRGRLCFDQDDDDRQTSSSSPEATDPAKMAACAGNLLTVSLQGIKGPMITAEETIEMDDRNPDVIPHTSDLDYPTAEYNPVYENQPIITRSLGSTVNLKGSNQKESYSAENYEYTRVPTPIEQARFDQPLYHLGLRDASTQSNLPPEQCARVAPPYVPSQQPQFTIHPVTQKISVETQTPNLVRHKESAV